MIALLGAYPNYRTLLIAQAVRQIGTFAAGLLIAYTAWTVGSPAYAGLVVLLSAAPSILAPWLLGHVSDRIGRRTLLTACSVAEAVLLAVLAFTVSITQIDGRLAVLGVLLGLVNACHTPLFGAAATDAADGDRSGRVSVGIGLSYDVAKVFGAFIAGAAVATGRYEITVGLTALLAAGAAVATARAMPASAPVRLRRRRGAAPRTALVAVPWAQVVPGIAAAGVCVALAGQLTLILVAFGDRGAGPALLGSVGMAFGFGATAGNLMLLRAGALRHRHIVWGAAQLAVVLMAGALVDPDRSGEHVLVALTFGYGFGLAYFWQAMRALTVGSVDPAVRGRVSGMTSLATGCLGTAGALGFGQLADRYGTDVALAMASGGAVLSVTVMAALMLLLDRRARRT